MLIILLRRISLPLLSLVRVCVFLVQVLASVRVGRHFTVNLLSCAALVFRRFSDGRLTDVLRESVEREGFRDGS